MAEVALEVRPRDREDRVESAAHRCGAIRTLPVAVEKASVTGDGIAAVAEHPRVLVGKGQGAEGGAATATVTVTVAPETVPTRIRTGASDGTQSSTRLKRSWM